MTKYYEKNVKQLTKWQPSCPWPDGPMARWPGLLCYQLWPGPRFWAVTIQHLHGTMRSFEDKSFKCFHVEKRIPMLIVECRDSCQSWQWRLSFRTLIRLGPLWWTNSHWENLAPWLAPVRHRHPYTAPVHGTRTQHSQPWTKPRPFDIRLHSNGFDTFRRAYTHVSFMSCFLLPEEPLHLQSEIYKFVRVLCVQKPCMVKPF